MRWPGCAVGTVLLVAVACSPDDNAGPAPHGQPGIRFVSGNNVSDSVGTQLPLPLIVEIHDRAGALAPPATLVRFEPVTDAVNGPEALVGALGSSIFAPVADGATDASGRTGARVVLPTVPKQVRIVVRVPALGIQDTARFVAIVGGVASIELAPRDTTIVAGRTYSIAATMRDRFGNVRQSEPTWTLRGSEAGGTVTAAGVASASATGRYVVVASIGTTTDSVYFSAVPAATLVAHDRGRGLIVAIGLDGSNRRSLASVNDGNVGTRPRWLPDGTSVIYSGFQDFSLSLFSVDSGESPHPFLQSSLATVFHLRDPAPTSDGSWVYLSASNSDCVHHGYCLHRVRVDGSGLQLVAAARSWPEQTIRPSPSPDGRRVALNTLSAGIARVRVLDLVTSTFLPLDLVGSYPEWSPIGETIAYLEGDGSLSVVNATGLGRRRLVDGSGVLTGRAFSWSPDGTWIVYNGNQGLSLVRAQDGMVVPLPGISGLIEPSWR